jgi:REP element-mobilizing transposase RayT
VKRSGTSGQENKKGHLYRINSVSDHAHILFTLPSVIALSDFMRDLKASTSKAVKSAPGFEHFTAWSEGFAGLSYSLRDKDMLVKYIINRIRVVFLQSGSSATLHIRLIKYSPCGTDAMR